MNKFRSKLEERVAKSLDKRKLKYKYESKKFDYIIERTYTPDFELPNGILIETKGWHRGLPEALRKLRAVKEQHPDIDLRIVWENKNMKITKKMTAEDWSKKYGFIYYEKIIPKKWYKLIESN